LREAIHETRLTHPFSIDAWVPLREHLHCIWSLPHGDADYSIRWALIKRGFTKRAKEWLSTTEPGRSRARHREAAIWQRRFWEHMIRDECDFAAHCDYIHYNPVKHELVSAPRDWPYSTFHRFVEQGTYPPDWGATGIAFADDVGRE
jgi:putative transposase